ncbi:MAG: amidohydrolase [Bacteroidales bacterium]|jgi:predicted amidohydrolase|nr:amidohydrolase [Bacteroidales bacterium]HOI33344.1 amidohydrolase [Bacteroidales bacterium]
MQNLTLAFIQTDLHWENPEANRNHFETLIAGIKQQTDLIVLPETFNTGFPVDPKLWAEPIEGKTMQWMQKLAAHYQSVITGSILLKADSGFQNTLIWMQPDGNYKTYAKRHVFRLGGEHKRIQPGQEQLFVELKGWKIKPLVCYDLRFPVWCKNTVQNGEFAYDLLLFVANWPAVRALPWQQLLTARAIENMAYVLGVNRIGSDPEGISYQGDSRLIDFKGQPISQAFADKESILVATINKADLTQFREKFNVSLDWDSFAINT